MIILLEAGKNKIKILNNKILLVKLKKCTVWIIKIKSLKK
jgi:hypothetical protein